MGEALYRLFVSSPGDVGAERARAGSVVEKLNAEFNGRARFDAELWEDHFYSAHETFQRQIPEAADFQLVIAIFRARLGSPLPAGFRRQPSGEPYLSGTAYEVLTALEKRRAASFPDIYVFRYPKAPEISLDDPNRIEIEEQWRALEGFFARWFKAPDGEFVAAFQTFESADDFAGRLEACLREWLAKRGITTRQTWDRRRLGSPFPGLAAFDADRESVFFGRDIAIRQAVARLREAKTPFLLILGASGSGKSSLLYAGLIPVLMRPGAVPEIDRFRVVVIAPGPDPFADLADCLLAPQALGPELASSRFGDREALIQALRGDPATAALVLGGALDKVADARRAEALFDTDRPARLLLAIDQAERLFAEAPMSAEAFGALLRALTGAVAYTVMVIRSDAYPRFQACSPLLSLRDSGATFDLIPPTPAELADIVERPVAACEPPLAFGECDPPLSRRLVADATGGDALPLLQMTLEELYRAQEARGDNLLRPEDYKGMAAAVTEAANAAVAHLGAGTKQALEALVASLVVDVAADPVTAELAPILAPVGRDGFVRGRPERAALVESFVKARLLTVDGGGRIRPTHEALLRIWPEAAGLVKEMTSLIRTRHTLTPLAQAWAEAVPGDKPRYLEVSPPLLAAGQELLGRFGDDLGVPLRPFILDALAAAEVERMRQRRRRQALFAATFTGLVAMTALAGVAAWQWREALAQKAVAVESRNEALAQKATAERNLSLAINTANTLADDVALKFRELAGVPASMIKSVLGKALDLERNLLASGQSSPELLESQGWTLIQISETLASLGETSGALEAARDAASAADRLGRLDPSKLVWRRILVTAQQAIGSLEVGRGRLGPALEAFQTALANLEILTAAEPNNTRWQSGLAMVSGDIGSIELKVGKSAEAVASYKREIEILRRATAADPNDAFLQRVLAMADESVGDLESQEGHLGDAVASYSAELEIFRRLAEADPSNTGIQLGLSSAEGKIGGAQSGLGHFREAAEAYEAETRILDKLAASDPANLNWRYNLAMARRHAGDVDLPLGRAADALNAYETALAGLQDLTKADPNNTGWQADRANLETAIGAVQVGFSKLPDAISSLGKGLEIIERLAQSDPSNVNWQRQLSVSYQALGFAQRANDQLADALESYRAAGAIAERFVKSNPTDPGWKDSLVISYQAMGELQTHEEAWSDALSSYRAGLAVAQPLADSDPSNTARQYSLAACYLGASSAYAGASDAAHAREMLEAGRSIMLKLVALAPNNPAWKNSLDQFENRLAALKP